METATPWYGAYIGLGSNLGDPKANLRNAVALLESKEIQVVLRSSLYRSKPWGYAPQPFFVNAVVGVLTRQPPLGLLQLLKSVEKDMGRVSSTIRYGPRIIDLDILLFGNLVLKAQNLQIPHPRWRERDFVLRPLCDIASMICDPVSGKSVRELYEMLPTDSCEYLGEW
ncbi:MAG TPA: 2-amino-4-hydroxy-6-hydroxymethyldihydropteridine diphosphokinase [Thermotogota bacterium]|nr:2-amino-4-hydroxy-6-hydroxymethyldihydropteridine diphosphokinase [Thermotogota bacterium]